VDAASRALAGGVRFFQYRNKNGSRREIYEVALRLVRVIRENGALFILNDHVDIAAAIEAHGVHLGQDDLPLTAARRVLAQGMLAGISTHNIDQARAAQEAGADYIGFGPVYQTSTKEAGAVQGLEALTIIARAVSIPVIAIGGITRDTIKDVMSTGASGAAVIGALCAATDITAASAEMIESIRSSYSGRTRGETR